MPKRALILWGGWEGHHPAAIAGIFERALQGSKKVSGDVPDENAIVFGGVSGHAGALRTAADLALEAWALVGTGEIDGRDFPHESHVSSKDNGGIARTCRRVLAIVASSAVK
jgi:hypothetical protein